MSADRLREAARVLRERAEAEAKWPCPQYIRSAIRHVERNCDVECTHGDWDEASERYVNTECPRPDGHWDRYTTGEFIATMHPGVALAVAAVLDAAAEHVASFDCQAHCEYPDGCDTTLAANALADAILGGTQ